MQYNQYSTVQYLLGVSVVSVQLEHVGSLQPVREEGQEVGGQVYTLQPPECPPLLPLTVTFIITAPLLAAGAVAGAGVEVDPRGEGRHPQQARLLHPHHALLTTEQSTML